MFIYGWLFIVCWGSYLFSSQQEKEFKRFFGEAAATDVIETTGIITDRHGRQSRLLIQTPLFVKWALYKNIDAKWHDLGTYLYRKGASPLKPPVSLDEKGECHFFMPMNAFDVLEARISRLEDKINESRELNAGFAKEEDERHLTFLVNAINNLEDLVERGLGKKVALSSENSQSMHSFRTEIRQ